MTRFAIRVWLLAIAIPLPVPMVVGQEPKPDAVAKPESTAKLKTIPVTVGSIQTDVTFAATIAPSESSEISVSLKNLTALKVEDVVSHGSSVKQGDILIRFDTQRDRKVAQRLAEIAWERFQLTFPLQVEKAPLGLAKARQELQKATKTLEQQREDLKACGNLCAGA